MSSPPVGPSIAMGVRAAAREVWLLPVSAVVAFVRATSLAPALAIAITLPIEGATLAMRIRPLSFAAPFEAALAVATSVRYVALVTGLALAGSILSGLLRVLFLSGALPTLGARLAGDGSPRSFAAGVAWGFPGLLGTSLLGALGEVAAVGYLLAAAAATLQAGTVNLRGGQGVALAALGALSLATGLAGLVVSRVLADAAAARAAILAERPVEAFAGAARRYLARPGGFTLGGLAFAAAMVAAGSVLQPATAILGRLGDRLDWALALGPHLMLAVLTSLAAAAVDLGWLGSVSALACGEIQDRGPAERAPRLSA